MYLLLYLIFFMMEAYGIYIFWVSVALLVAIVLYCFGVVGHDYRKVNVPIAYAGSIHDLKPSSAKVKAKYISILRDKICKNYEDEPNLNPFLIKGDSMQYASIHTDDIVFASKGALNIEALPVVVVIQDKESSQKSNNFKLRRAWKIVPPNIGCNGLHDELNQILHSEKFEELRILLGEKCPDNEILTDTLLQKFRINYNNGINAQLIISTTYNTNDKKIEFSLHEYDDLVGEVKFIANRKGA